MFGKNCEKLTPPPPCLKNVRTDLTPFLLVRADTPLISINPYFDKSDSFCTKKFGRPHLKNPPLSENVRTEQPPLIADVFYGRSQNQNCKSQ